MASHVRHLLKRTTVNAKIFITDKNPRGLGVDSRPKRFFSLGTAIPVKPPLVRHSATFRRAARLIFTSLFFSGAGFLLATMPAFRVADGFLNPPTDDESLTLFTPKDYESKEIEDFINNHPLSQEMRSNPVLSESRPHLKIPEPQRANNLTGGTLSGPEMLVVPPVFWMDHGGHSLVSIVYLGKNLCGHPDLIHGGLLATLLDEGFARCCATALPNKVSMTACLNIDYRNPAPAGSYVVLRAKVRKVDGRKAWVDGHIETLASGDKKPVILAEASGVFIEPKQAAAMARVYPI